MRPRRIALLGFAAVMVAAAVMAAGAVFLLTGNPTGAVGFLASRVTGVRVVIDGDASLDLMPETRMSASRIRLLAAGDRTIGSISHFAIALDLPRILWGVLYVRSLQVDEADLLVETQAGAGAGIGPPSPRFRLIPVVESADVRRSRLRYRQLPDGDTSSVAIERLQVETVDGRVQIVGKGTIDDERRLEIHGDLDPIATLWEERPYSGSLALSTSEGHLRVKGSMARPLELEGIDADLEVAFDELAKLAAWFHLDVPPLGSVAGRAHVGTQGEATSLEGIDLTLAEGGFASLVLRGDVADVQALRGVDLLLDGRVDDLNRLSPLVGRELPDSGALHLAGKLTDHEGTLRFEDVRAHGGHEQLGFELAGHFADVRELRGIEVDVQAEASSLALLGALFGLELPKLGPIELSARVSDADGRLTFHALRARVDQTHLDGELSASLTGPPSVRARLSSERVRGVDLGLESEGPPADLPFARLAELDVDVGLQAQRIQLRALDFGPVDLTLRLHGARPQLVDLTGTIAGGQLAATGEIDTTQSPPALHLRGGATGLDLPTVLGRQEEPADARVTVDLGFALSSRGSSTEQIVADVDGAIALAVSNVDGAAPAGWLVDTSRLRAALYSGPRWDRSPVQCLVGEFGVSDGKALVGVLLAETRHSVIRGTGTVDLSQREVDLVLTPTPIHASLLSLTTAVHVHGPIGDPEVEPLKASVAKTAAKSALGAMVVPGAGLLLGFAKAGSLEAGSCARISTEIASNTARLELGEGSAREIDEGSEDGVGTVGRWMRALGRTTGVSD